MIGVSRAALEAAACGAPVILAGNEGFGGVLDAACFSRFAAANFTCRGEPALTDAALLEAFGQLLQAPPDTAAVRSLLLADYTAAAMAQKTEQIYAAAIRKAPAALHKPSPKRAFGG